MQQVSIFGDFIQLKKKRENKLQIPLEPLGMLHSGPLQCASLSLSVHSSLWNQMDRF